MLLPPADLALTLALAPQGVGRTLTAHAHTERGRRCVDAIVRVFGAVIATD